MNYASFVSWDPAPGVESHAIKVFRLRHGLWFVRCRRIARRGGLTLLWIQSHCPLLVGLGTFITRSIIEDRYRTIALVSELFAQSLGVMRVQVSATDYSVFFLRAGAMAINLDKPCPATGYIDGLPYGRELPRLALQDIEAIEIYRGPSEIPPQYGGATPCVA